MEVKERIAYVRGLIEGAENFQPDPTGRTVWENLLLVCDELAESVAQMETAQSELEEYVEAIDADLCELEDEVYGDERRVVTFTPEDADAFEDDENDEEFVRIDCPHCGQEVFFEEEFLYDDSVEISCPECGEILFRGSDNGHIDFDEEDESVAPLTEGQE